MKPGMVVASMGYPDIVANPRMIADILGDKLSQLKFRDDSEAICDRHGLSLRKIPDAVSFFNLMGCELAVYDIVKERGCEILCDLNIPMVSKEYDIVLDVGTAEHCFNISQAMFNMAGMVKVGGFIIHENPFNYGNHGFYNLNPTFYHDFYKENGFEVEDCILCLRDGRGMKPPEWKRFRFIDEEANVFVLAVRKEKKQFVFPTQSKYVYMSAAGKSGERDASERAIGEVE